jgi:hypothetical protein
VESYFGDLIRRAVGQPSLIYHQKPDVLRQKNMKRGKPPVRFEQHKITATVMRDKIAR